MNRNIILCDKSKKATDLTEKRLNNTFVNLTFLK